MANQISTLRMEQKSKKTPAGNIPVDWDVARISDVCEINPGKTEAANLDREMVVSFIRMENLAENGGGITGSQTETLGDVITKGYTCFRDGDILFAKITPCLENGKVALAKNLVNGIGFGSTEFHVLRANHKKIHPEIIFHWISRLAFREVAARHFRGTAGQQRVQRDFFDLTFIPIPPIDEQRGITAALSVIDSAIDKTRQLLARKHLLKKGLTRKAFKSKPLSQKQFYVGDCAQINTSALSSATDPKKVIRYIDIATIEKTGIISPPKEMLFGEAPSRARRIVKFGDILVSTVRPYLRAFAKVESTAPNLIASTGFCVLASKKNVSPDYLYQFVLSDIFVNFLEGRMSGSNYPAVNPSDIAECPIPLPTRSEQDKISRALSASDFSIRNEEAALERLESIKQGLMTLLLTGRRRIGQQRGSA